MRLTMKERKKATAILAPRYQKARKKDKVKMLDEFIALTGYRRSYASYVLSTHGKRKRIGKNYIMQADVRKKTFRKRTKFYDEEVRKPLI
ncbi:MAG: transposase, partial [Nitrospirae bacterium]|nr:transposase [Nitrospirota bacterium]